MNPSAPRAAATPPSTLRRWLREPLLHFMGAGFALFVVYGAMHVPARNGDSRRIELTADDIRHIEVSWRAQWQRPPTPEELRHLIEQQVRQEILSREALALGLERGDIIIKRRLAQKMEFFAEGVATSREPAPGEIEAWYAKNSAEFAMQPLATFHHLYFASDKRGAAAQADAAGRLTSLADERAEGGDAFMFESAYAEQAPDQVARVFGAKFASALYQLKAGAWLGPIESGYGWHLVWIDELSSGQVPAFETVAEQARIAWLSEQRAAAKQAAFDELKVRYEILVPEPVQVLGANNAGAELR